MKQHYEEKSLDVGDIKVPKGNLDSECVNIAPSQLYFRTDAELREKKVADIPGHLFEKNQFSSFDLITHLITNATRAYYMAIEQAPSAQLLHERAEKLVKNVF